MHVCESHCPQGSEEITCQWDRCDNMKRKRFSLMTHLYDKHCNTEVIMRKLQLWAGFYEIGEILGDESEFNETQTVIA